MAVNGEKCGDECLMDGGEPADNKLVGKPARPKTNG